MKHSNGEVRDVPALGNDMNDSPATTGKALDTADAPGKADAEMGAEDSERGIALHPPGEAAVARVTTATRAGECDPREENPPKVVADEGQPGG